MIVSNCPRCDEVFRVPDAEMPDDAYAECPWCKETFPIVEVLHRLPPVLNVISADGQALSFSQQRAVMAGGLAGEAGEPSTIDQSEYYDGGIGTLGDDEPDDLGHKTVSEETVAETWTDVRTSEGDSSVADFDVEDPHDTLEEGGPAGDVRPVAPMKVTPAPVLHRKSRGSNTRTWISIVLGGLAAGPLAVAILWVLTLFGVDVDLGFWPLNGTSAVVSTDRVAAAPVPLTNEEELGPKFPARPPVGGDEASLPTDSGAVGDVAGVETEDPEDAALREIIGSSSQQELVDASEGNVVDPGHGADPEIETGLGDASGDSLTEFVMPGDTEPPTADRDSQTAVDASESLDSAKLASDSSRSPVEDDAVQIGDSGEPPAGRAPKRDATPTITMPPIDTGKKEISPDAAVSDVVDTSQAVPSSDDVPAMATPNPAVTPAELAVEAPKPAASTPTNDAVEPAAGRVETAAGLQPKRSDRPAKAETAKSEEVASTAKLPRPQPALKTRPRSKPEPKVETEPAELVQAAGKARDMLDQLSKIDRSDLTKTKFLLRDTYIAIATVGAVARTDSESVRRLLRNVTSSPDLDVWSQNTTAWLALGTRRPTEGVFLVGKPLSDADGQRIAISDDDVVSLTDDSTQLPSTDRVLGLGRIVEAGSGQTIALVAVESLP